MLGVQRWEQERGDHSWGFEPQGGPGRMERSILLPDLKGGQLLQRVFCEMEWGTTSWGRRSCLLIAFLPLPSPFRCIPRTDGGSEADCQQGSKQPFPGAPTSLDPARCPSLPVPILFSCSLYPCLGQAHGTEEGGGGLFNSLACGSCRL